MHIYEYMHISRSSNCLQLAKWKGQITMDLLKDKKPWGDKGTEVNNEDDGLGDNYASSL